MMGETEFMPESAFTLNQSITISALFVGAVQLLFLYNMIVSLKKGKPAGPNPWKATTLEWQTPDTPPKHGNWGHELPVVHRWAYDYSVPGYPDDFIPQNVPDDATPAASEDESGGPEGGAIS
jgi:cytochrome c oxidase subunit 1